MIILEHGGKNGLVIGLNSFAYEGYLIKRENLVYLELDKNLIVFMTLVVEVDLIFKEIRIQKNKAIVNI